MNEIFSYFIPRSSDDRSASRKRLAYASWFIDTFPQTEFEKEERIMWFLLEYVVEMGVVFKRKYMETFLNAELKELLAKTGTRVSGAETLSFEDVSQLQTAVDLTKNVMGDVYTELEMVMVDLEEFRASADAFISEQLNDRLINLYQKGFTMLNSMQQGSNIGARDALEFTQVEAEKIAEIYSREHLEELESNNSEEDEDASNFAFVTDFGLQTIDKDCGGMYTTQMFGLDAAPGQGKTRFATGVVVYRAAVVHKRNTLIYSLEQSYEEMEAMLVSKHIYELFKTQISDGEILKRKEKPLSEKANDQYKAAKIDLFDSGKYGKIHIVCKELFINDFINKLRVQDSIHGPFEVIVIDYMALIDQKAEKGYRMVDDFKVTAKAYKVFKRYLRRTRKAGFAINQFNAEGTRAAKEDKEVGPTGTAGGMEAHRSVDYMLSMTASSEMEAQRKRRLSNTKKRGTEGFGSVVVDVRLGFCHFYQNVQQII